MSLQTCVLPSQTTVKIVQCFQQGMSCEHAVCWGVFGRQRADQPYSGQD